MDEREFQKYLKERYEDQLEWYESKVKKNKQIYMSLQFVLIVFSIVVPIFIVINYILTTSTVLQWITIMMSIVVAILVSSLKTFNFHENWVRYRTTAENLKKELIFFRAESGPYVSVQDNESLFVERVESYISRRHSSVIYNHKFHNSTSDRS